MLYYTILYFSLYIYIHIQGVTEITSTNHTVLFLIKNQVEKSSTISHFSQ